ncbi:MAG: lipopolysaccharide heptosyltransferase II [Deltaproteobacteria bacterium]|nr:lipopolysaccharide heptosyltransferase II [Deltaproteobacteria bacterium]
MDKNNIRTILIRGANWVGDALMTTPVVEAIRHNFPEARISLLVVPWVMDLFTHNPHSDEVIPYFREGRHKGLRGKRVLLKEIKGRKFDLSILLQNAFEAALLAWGARIPRRAGYNTDWRGWLLTHAVPLRPEYKKVHQTQYYLAMARGLGLEAPDTDMFLQVPDEYTTYIHSRLKRYGYEGRPLIVLAPGATYGSAKMWPGERYSLLATELARYCGAGLIILGSVQEKGVGDGIVRGVGQEMAVNLSGATSLLEAAAWIKQATLVISNDSGLMHMAAALSKPQLAIFGPTNRITTGPRNRKAHIIYHETACAPCLKVRCPTDHKCMASITVEEIFEAACRMLSTYSS